MEMFVAPLHMVHTFRNLIVLQEYALMLMTSTMTSSTSVVDHLCYVCLVFVMLSRQFIAALWSPAGKGLTSWLLLVVFICVLVTFPCGILGQMWYLIVSIPDLCPLFYFIFVLLCIVLCPF